MKEAVILRRCILVSINPIQVSSHMLATYCELLNIMEDWSRINKIKSLLQKTYIQRGALEQQLE